MTIVFPQQSVTRIGELATALTDEEFADVNSLLEKVGYKGIRNSLRARYYNAKQTVQQLGIAIPPQLNSVETVIGWPAKSVDDLEQRIDLEGFVLQGASWSDFGLDRVWQDNQLALEASQAHTSALKFAVSFVAVLSGGDGEPDVVIRPLSALSSTVRWDSVRRRAASAITVTGVSNSEVVEFIYFTDSAVITVRRDDYVWTVERVGHNLGRCPVAVLPFRPSLEYPFGRSRISRAVMSITDRAIRSLLRMEVSAEFYSAPQRYVLGADEAMFQGANGERRTGWEVTIGRMLALPVTSEGEKPTVGQFPQLTMQPHVEMVRSEAAMFSGETGIPVNSLGIIHDNPASEAAMQTAYLPLVKTAERAALPFGLGWVDAMQMAYQLREGVRDLPDPIRGMRAKFRNPATSTRTEAANAAALFIDKFPWASESEVALEMFGLDRVDIDRLLIDKQRAEAGSRMTALIQAAQGLREANSGDLNAGGGVPGSEPRPGDFGAA